MLWQRLDRDKTLATIKSVRTLTDAGLFSPVTSEVQKAMLPFYNGIELYKLTNFASLPSFTFEYLGDGHHFHYLDGTEQPIHAVNDRGYLTLNERSVVDYLDFYMSHVLNDDDETVFIRNPYDMPLLQSLEPQSIDALLRNHKIPSVSYDAGFDKHTIEADIYSEGHVLRATIEINNKGRINILEREMVLNSIARSAHSGIMA